MTIPNGATHCLYTTTGGHTEIIADISARGDFSGRGKLRFGIYYPASDRFKSLMPEDKDDPYLENREELVTRSPINEHRTMKSYGNCNPCETREQANAKIKAMQEVAKVVQTTVPPKAPKLPQIPKAPTVIPRAPSVIPKAPTAIARPSGGKTAQVWEAADALVKKLGREPSKKELEQALPGHNTSTISVQFSAWRKNRAASGS
jgi:hypothetical protein